MNKSTELNLSNCDKEPIHKLGKIQGYGGLIAVNSRWQVSHCSTNIEQYCGLTMGKCIGIELDNLFVPQVLKRLQKMISVSYEGEQSERIFAEYLFNRKELYDISVYQSGQHIVIEFEYHHALEKNKSFASIRSSFRAMSETSSLNAFFMYGTDEISKILGFDRVMLYRFHSDGSGEVIAENVKNDMDSFLGLRYPASDIPQQARQLYVKNVTRLIENVNANTIEIVCADSLNEHTLDLSLSSLRAVSPIHIEYLKNMGVGASFSLSIVIEGRLWGLFACHHRSANYLSLELRSILEIYAEVFSLELASRLRNLSLVNTEKARDLHLEIMSSLNNEGSVFSNLQSHLVGFQSLIPSDTVFLWVDGKVSTMGKGISLEDIHLIVGHLNRLAPNDLVFTDNLQDFMNTNVTINERFAGLLAIPISRRSRDFLVFLRVEEAQTITWAGNPEKPTSFGANGTRLIPRSSFAAWQDIRRGYSIPWLQKEIGVAQIVRQMLLEIIVRNIDERQRISQQSEEQQTVLIHELNHRVRNVLGLINSIVAKTATGVDDVTEFRKVLGGRIESIALAQNQLTERNWSHAPFSKLIDIELSPYIADYRERISVKGSQIDIAPKAYTTLTLVIHELVTNTIKHGALRSVKGCLELSWSLSERDDLVISWSESGYENPLSKRKGFGSVIIGRSVSFDLGGDTQVLHHATGIDVKLTIPKEHIFVQEKDKSSPKEDISLTGTPEPISKVIDVALVLEDNMIIALDLEDLLKRCGIKTVYLMANTFEAETFLKDTKVDFAVLDVNLGDENSYAIGNLCQQKEIPFVFVTGYSQLHGQKSEGFEDIPILQKPIKEKQLKECLLNISAG